MSTFEEYKSVYQMLEDEESKYIYLNRVNWEISKNWRYIENIVPNMAIYRGMGTETAVKELRDFIPQEGSIVLYGAGKMSEQYFPFWKDDERFIGFCCKTKEKQANGYLGYPVWSPEALLSQKELYVVVSTVEYHNEILQILRDGGYPEDHIFDGMSCVYWDNLKEQYFGPEFMAFEDEEVFIDAGCFDLGTSLELKKHCKSVKKVYAFEPDAENFQNCMKRKEEEGFHQMELFQLGTWSKRATLHFQPLGSSSSQINENGLGCISVAAIDEIVDAAERVTMIKMDVEGAELESLKGARNTIVRDKPKIAVSLYHKPEDLTELPLYIKELVPEYKLYVRHHSNHCCETVLYAVIS